MSCKSFNICVVLDILDVTCPGVCICPKGMIYLDIWLFGCNNSTSYVEPKFPLTFNETFNFHKTFAKLSNLRDIQKSLEEKCIKIALVQAYKKKQVTLATYSSYVDEVLYPERSRLNKNGEMALLMKNEPLFPGTISPKITLVTKTSVTEQINVILLANHSSSQYLETQNQSNRMKRVHHSKLINSPCSHKTENRTTNDDRNINSDTDTDSLLYCSRGIKTNNNIMDLKCRLKQSCKHCEDENKSKINEHINENRDCKNTKECLNLKHKSLDNDECENTGTTSNKFGKNMKATFNMRAHNYKCYKSKLNNSSSTNESMKTSDEDSILNEEKKTKNCVILKNSGEEPKKINPKIKARLHLDVYHCKCGMPD
ncbi:spermatogenesis-associated protein 6 isoform X2 [Melanaphis sacchari]|nr:spermatogenesis-associated protein 6 isoform X2 [Melanaphis sacchari]